jgi:hypothetical protein
MAFYINNQYPATIWVCIQWWDPACPSTAETWRTEGWFQFEPGETGYCNIAELQDMRNVGDSYFYYYIEASDGAYWAGPFGTWCPNTAFNWCNAVTGPDARNLGFRELVVTTADYTLVPVPLNPRTMMGKWVTTVTGITVTMDLIQSGSAVSGTSTTNISPDVLPVSGSVSGNNVSLQDSTGRVAFNGAFTDDNTVTGTFRLDTLSGPATLSRV